MMGVIDRFEGGIAVVEINKGKMLNIAKEMLPTQVKEGDVLNIGDTITINIEETEKRKKEIEELTKDIFQE